MVLYFIKVRYFNFLTLSKYIIDHSSSNLLEKMHVCHKVSEPCNTNTTMIFCVILQFII